jgi:hypothetical protein
MFKWGWSSTPPEGASPNQQDPVPGQFLDKVGSSTDSYQPACIPAFLHHDTTFLDNGSLIQWSHIKVKMVLFIKMGIVDAAFFESCKIVLHASSSSVFNEQ